MFAYIHIPFCESKCKYCKFSSFSKIEESKIKFYIDFLIKSIEENTWKIESLDSIYFWWWTPSSIDQKYIVEVIEVLKKKYWFKDDIEITIETTPQNITNENIEIWEKNWVNRVSVWVQSLLEKTLYEIWRDKKEKILKWLTLLDNSKIKSISVDFIIGLPFVEKGWVKNDITYILDTFKSVNHISVYMLEDYYYWEKWKDLILKEEDFLSEYLEIKDLLNEREFLRYELSNFAKIGYECKHNKAYWNHSDIVAFWLGAHGFQDWKRYAFWDTFTSYYSWKKLYEEWLSKSDIVLECIMFWLRTTGISQDLQTYLDMNKVKYYLEEKFLEKKWETLILGEKGITLLDYILKEIIL